MSGRTDFRSLAAGGSGSGSKMERKRTVDSPFAKYNSVGQLSCIVCNQPVKSELIWTAHLKSKLHLENKKRLKSSLKAQPTDRDKEVFKRPSEPEPSSVSSIKLKTSTASTKTAALSAINPQTKKQKLEHIISETDSIDLNNGTTTTMSPAELTQRKQQNKQLETQRRKQQEEDEEKEAHQEKEEQEKERAKAAAPVTSSGVDLPEGFFDDAELDDKVRGVSHEANMDAEFEAFKKIIQTEEVKSEILIKQDDLARDVERDIEQVDDLIARWSNIETLHQKREALLKKKKDKKARISSEKMDHDSQNSGGAKTSIENKKSKKKREDTDDEDESGDDDLDLDNVLGLALRSKNRY